MTSNSSKPKKTIFTNQSTEDFSQFHFQRQRELKTGDSNENNLKTDSYWLNENGNDEAKISKTVLVDKKNLKHLGHFSRLKKRNQEDYNKFLEQKSKNIELCQLKATIEKIQSKIDELSKQIEFKTLSKGSVEDSTKFSYVKDSVAVSEVCQFKLNPQETLKSIGIVALFVILLVLILCTVEGQFFFNSILVPGSLNLKTKFTKSIS